MTQKKNPLHIALVENIHPYASTLFSQQGFTGIESHKSAIDKDGISALLQKANILGLRSKTKVRGEALTAAKHLETIGCFCIGTDQVDLTTAAQQGIPVFNAPYASTRSVAELVIGQIIMLLRRIPEKSAGAHRGEWMKGVDGACEVRGKILGIIGYGHIGTQLSVMAESIGMRVMFYDIVDKLALGNAQRATSLEQLLSQSDIVTLHVPATKQTEKMIGATELAQMKCGAPLINAARGKVVDLDALADSLKSGYTGGAAIDVFPVEPVGNDEVFTTPLQNLSNVILTPHIGGSTLEAQESIAADVTEKILRYIQHGTTAGAVNFPQVTLPPLTAGKRFRHTHHNQPGVLAKINDVFSSRNLNIAAQYLQTDDTIGYVVIDTDTPNADSAVILAALQEIPGTIRTALIAEG
jgi:D-3-phosphoglycerate dehydrogenase